jgi:PAS domain S-box-containing protein
MFGLSNQIDTQDIDLRKRWLSFRPDDEQLIAEIDHLLEENIDPLIDDMYAHFLTFPETKKYFPDDATLKRAQKAQGNYFRRLTKGNYDAEYVAERIAVGTTHYRIGLDPVWYLGAYNRVMTWLRKLVGEKYDNDHQKFAKVMAALTRVVFFDMTLAIDSYMIAKEKAIREQRDAIVELEADKRVTKGILENAPVGIVRLDRNLNCVECNEEFLEMLDESIRPDFIGKNLFDVAEHLDADPFTQVLRSGQGCRKNGDVLNFSGDKMGSQFWDWAAWPMKSERGSVVGLVATFTNVTDRVLLQQQREDFVATLTHDLKTPILAANRAIKLLLDGDFGEVAEAQAKILETIQQSNESQYKMVQTLLDVYRYDSGAKKLSLVETDLRDVVQSLVDEVQPLTNSRQIELTVNLPKECQKVLCDSGELRRVIQNLVDNAIKFTPAGGKITATLQQDPDRTLVSVTDTGKGISEDDKPKLFQRFWQASSSSGRYYASTGLGLYLCRKIVELHDGRIWCESEPGKGSTFFFTIRHKLKEEQST